MKFLLLSICLASVLILPSCGEDSDTAEDTRIKSGELTYKVTYPYVDSDNFLRIFLPKKMIRVNKYENNLKAFVVFCLNSPTRCFNLPASLL